MKTRKLTGTIFALALLIPLSGCKYVVFSSPPQPNEAMAPDPTPFFGEWKALEEPDVPADQRVELRIDQGADSLEATLRQDGESLQRRMTLHEIGDLWILSLELGPDMWLPYQALLDEAGNQLVLREPDLDLFKTLIHGGSLEGQIYPVDSLSELVTIESSGEVLASVIEQNPQLFSAQAFVLDRQ